MIHLDNVILLDNGQENKFAHMVISNECSIFDLQIFIVIGNFMASHDNL